ncbi:glycosyltransferase family 2 protein [Desulfosporosinus sp. FKA]|uniref:glycosyltransferase family 2 protein n=1 Tax=Desulfosporosinus sp. FKA TaxID=1969834 RepID=UPI000B49F513|nr:glycosyltransferase family 2 protein [Desulfosporosinus sp. FKA]
MQRILAIVPALNEARNIGTVVDNLKEVSSWLDVLVIDDGSTDQTAEVARSHGAKVISLPVNLGIGGAVQTGFLYAVKNHYDVALQVDGDGQHRAEEIRKLTEPILRDRADVTIGSRFLSKTAYKSSLSRRMGIYLLSKTIQSVVRRKYTDPTSGFRAYNQKALRMVSAHYSTDYPEPDAIVTLVKNGIRVIEVSVEMDARISGSSSITPFKSGYYMFKVSLAIILNSMMSRIWPDQ